MFPQIREFIEKNLTGLLMFGVGILLGLGFVLLFFYIMNEINKKQKPVKKEILTPNGNPDEVIGNSIDKYKSEYAQLAIGKRVSGAKDICLSLLDELAHLYYDSSNAMYEIEIGTAFKLVKDLLAYLDDLVNQIISHPLFKVLWFGFAAGSNFLGRVKGFFNKKYERQEDLKLDIRKMKLSDVVKRLEKNGGKDKQPKTEEESNQKKSYFVFDKFINDKICELIRTVGTVSNDVYSNKYDGGDD